MRRTVKFREIKSEIRILGVDDCSFKPRQAGRVTIIGLVFRGGKWLDGAMKTSVAVDGLDATKKIIRMIKSSPHYYQLRVIMLNGISFAGFNIVNIKQIFESTELPVIAITRKNPNMGDITEAIKKLPYWEKRLKTIQEAGDFIKLRSRRGSVYTQLAGILIDDAEKILQISCTNSITPEPLRVAHIVASGLAKSVQMKRKKV